jgi:hypothetical protein
VTSFQAVHFSDEGREVILIYALGADGIVYECGGGTWLPLPINEETIVKKKPDIPATPLSRQAGDGVK